MTLEKPASVASNPFRSAKWDEITDGREFRKCDIPVLSSLCYWYQVQEKCMEDITYGDDIQVAYQNDIGDVKAFPQLATMQKASAEIRALNKQLGINDEVRAVDDKPKETKLYVIQSNRRAKAANSARTA